jgi:hypothetical protein
MINISRSCELEDDKFKVHLYTLDDQDIEYYLQLSKRYNYLKEYPNMLIMKVLSKNVENEILFEPAELVETINRVISDLIEVQMFEQCAVLKSVRDTYIRFYSNDN